MTFDLPLMRGRVRAAFDVAAAAPTQTSLWLVLPAMQGSFELPGTAFKQMAAAEVERLHALGQRD